MASENCVEIMASENCDVIMASKSCVQSVQVSTVVLLVSAVILFVLLILRDVGKAVKRRAHWVPGDFLVLSALTIELVNLISTQGQPLNWEQKDILLVEFWTIHTSRVMLCIVIGYLMPAMANPGAEDFWGKITSLAITVFLHVISELYFINPKSAGEILKSLWPRQRGTSIRLYYIMAAIIFCSFVLLVLLLACANIAGRGVERIVARKIRLILKEQVKEDHQHFDEWWKKVEDAVLRAWIVARAYSLDYVIARSPLASSAATIVTIQIAITLLAGVRKSPKMLICTPLDKLRFSITMMQCVFILIGWAMILFRWVTAVAYYGNWSSCFRIEDFWTRHLRELQEAEKNNLPQSQLLHAKIEKMVVNQSTQFTLPRYILYPVIWVQLFTVSFSKACLLGSQILLHNKLTGKILSSIVDKKLKGAKDYRTTLEGVRMLGERPESLWLSNRQSIPIAAELISRGKGNGEQNYCKRLVGFLATKRSCSGLGLGCLDPSKVQPGLKYLCKRRQAQEEQFVSRKPWKMTAVSLLSIIVQLSPICDTAQKEHPSTSHFFPPKVVSDCLDAYSQAWEIIDFVDKADTEPNEISSEAADEIASEAADKYFDRVRKKGLFLVSNFAEATVSHSVTAALMDLKKECKTKTETPGCVKVAGSKTEEKTQRFQNGWTGGDSTDWKAEEWGTAVYKLCNSIECNEGTDVNDLLKELESCLADIINECLEQFQRVLLLNCKKWALKRDERKIAKALYTTGKASKIMKLVGEGRE